MAETIIHNAKIWTGNPDEKFAEAMAVKGDTIMAIGSNEDILELKSENTNVIDLEEKFVTPGFIDSHLHFITGGFNLTSVQLRDAASKEEFLSRIKEYAANTEPGTWILGGDWDHKNWGGELPAKEWIDSITPNNPVFISRLDGHMALANSLALDFFEINKNTESIDGGLISKDEKGELTGILKDNAMYHYLDKIPAASEKSTDQALKNAMNYVASNGVTSVHHMIGYMDALQRARKKNELITRFYVAYPLNEWNKLKQKIEKEGYGDNWIKIGGLKGFIDGSLGSHTAAFMESYTDKPSDRGFFVESREDMYKWIKDADNADLQIMIHAIGDSAIHFLLNTYEKVGIENGERDRRFRIEHAQHLAKDDIPRFGKLEVIASMQPYHAIDDGRWAEKVVGKERAKTTYAFKSLMESDATVAFGSDWFVAPPVPLYGIYAATTRRTLDNKNPNGWIPEQKISVEQALIAYTRNAAYASFDDNIKGSLEEGKLADFVILNENILEIDPVKIKDVKVLQTYVGGVKVYDISGTEN
ncbi:MAG: amidohydrolase [Bacteroidota bacterium]